MYCTLGQRWGVGKGEAWHCMKDLFQLNSEVFPFFFLFVSKAGWSGWCQHFLGCVESVSPTVTDCSVPKSSYPPLSSLTQWDWWAESCHHPWLRCFTFIQEIFPPALALQLCKKKKMLMMSNVNLIMRKYQTKPNWGTCFRISAL